MDQPAPTAVKSPAAEPPATRFVTACINNLIWLVPLVIIGWPVVLRLDPLVVLYCVVSVIGSALVAALVDPLSLRNRQGHDRTTELIVGLSSLVALIWAAADFGRLHYSDSVPVVMRWMALGLLVAGYAVRIGSVLVNTFFSSLVVIQADRGHRVVNTGPYALIRHPGNLSVLLIVFCAPLVLNSYLALIPMGVAALAVLRRTRLEDRFLRENLAGYPEYAARVRFRLIPGVY